ncbi:alpha/beta hydrolase [Streptomyces sp. NPDC058274]|uniref:alpha/beta hydrolase n=1 Tax=Streptomyces sp. NPDC058274 TaxID=3346416 RepID=UPI0036EC75A8
MASAAIFTVLAAMPAAPAGRQSAGMTATTALLVRYAHQKVTWTDCRQGPSDTVGETLDQAGAQCATLQVPLDYSRPTGRAISIAISRLKATDTGHRVGAMLLNGGGPGGGSIDLPPDISSLMNGVGARYDLIGMDPRSSGRSTPVDCKWPISTWMRSPGASRRDFDAVVALQRDLAGRCARTNGALLPYISTRNTARDMDIVRAALGEPQLSYYGASYGTYLGAVYAQMFPGRVGRMVLDSAVDPDDYGAEDMLADAAPANESALHDWATWTAGHNAEYHLGATRDSVLRTVDGIIATAAEQPLEVGDHRVDDQSLPFVLMNGLDSDQDEASASLAAAVQVLHQAAEGRAAEPTADLKDTLDFLFTGVESAAGSSQVAVLCGDKPVDRNPQAYWRRIQQARVDRPVIGPLLNNISPCAFWPTAPRERPTRIDNGVPALIVNSTGDTRTTYQNAQSLHAKLTGSRLVTLQGARIHAVFPRYANNCVNDTINDYFRTGVLPATDLSCTRTSAAPGPFP